MRFQAGEDSALNWRARAEDMCFLRAARRRGRDGCAHFPNEGFKCPRSPSERRIPVSVLRDTQVILDLPKLIDMDLIMYNVLCHTKTQRQGVTGQLPAAAAQMYR